MADVREKVEQIRQAVYGKEVRESIASGIEAINTDIDALNDLVDALDSRVDTIITTPISGEAAAQEIVDARASAVKSKTFATLDARFEEMEQDIATHKADSTAHGVSHKNLLHNWDFRNPVNQRGLTSTPASFQSVYTIDRWMIVNFGTVAVNSGYITVAGTGSTIPYLRQYVETPRVHFAGKTVTFSAYVRGSGRIFIQGSYVETYVNLTSWTLVKTTGTLTAERDLYVDIGALDVNGSFDVLCAKLELGSESTLANDPPADYGEQLALCKRYFRLWKTTEARTAALQEAGLMRLENPTLGTAFDIGGTTYYYASADL